MEVELHPALADNILARQAADAIEACVHCGFCLATCPTYLDSRDERDSPRGRIYLIKDLLETGASGEAAQHHLDRCLTCRSCETTCPSGVAYGDIADAGRALLEEAVPRGLGERLQRRMLRTVVPRRTLFGVFLRLGQLFRPVLPSVLKGHVPPRQAPLARAEINTDNAVEKVLLLEGCVQASATPNTNQALRNILSRLDVAVIESPAQGCCGALNTHLGALRDGRDDMRRNIDAWWPAIDTGATAIVFSATGCGTQLTDYGKALADDAVYAERAKRVSELAVDAGAFLKRYSLKEKLRAPDELPRVAVQVPCSQYHALGAPDTVRELLQDLGYPLARTRDDHLCCGSAGSYSILQPAMSQRLRQRKLSGLTDEQPDRIVSANVGCQLHLAAGTDTPVQHWLELIEERLT